MKKVVGFDVYGTTNRSKYIIQESHNYSTEVDCAVIGTTKQIDPSSFIDQSLSTDN